jgi:hypothetical protein
MGEACTPAWGDDLTWINWHDCGLYVARRLMWVNATILPRADAGDNSSVGASMRSDLALAAALAAALATPCGAQAQQWDTQFNLRVRHEHVDDAAVLHNADATTARLRAGLHGKFGERWESLLEAEIIGSAGNFNDGSNHKASWPAVIDPAGAELNQAWLRHKAGPASITVGRQRLLAANQRWLGNSGWRQNEQTFDAVALDWQLRPDLALGYRWLDRVHRIAGDDALDRLARERALDTHYLELAWKRGPLQLAPYALLHRDRDLATASTATWGLRGTMDRTRDGRGCRITADIARQREHGNNPQHFSHDYWLLEPACTVGTAVVRAGWEHLGGNGVHALQAPLGTLHAFNGWADKFNATPPGGLDDRYLGAGGKSADGRLDWQLAWHDYRADHGGRYGDEIDASLGFPVAKGVRGLVKLAQYQADGYARDTRKAWLQLEWAH